MQQLWTWYTEPFRKPTTLKGRASRGEYWTFTLVNAVLAWGLTFIDVAAGWYSEQFGMGLLGAILSFVLLLPSIAVTVRRLHDSDLGGGWFFIAFIPLIGIIVQLIQMLRKGTRGPNRYGPDPLGERVVVMPPDGGPPYARQKGRFMRCPWCGQSNPQGRDSCQWCHKPYREPQIPA